MDPATIAAIVSIVNASLPEVIAFFKGLHQAKNPGAPLPTDAEVLAALQQSAVATIAVDEQWKAAHPA